MALPLVPTVSPFAGLIPITMIACPLSTQQASAYDVEWAKPEKRLLGINRQLIVTRKP